MGRTGFAQVVREVPVGCGWAYSTARSYRPSPPTSSPTTRHGGDLGARCGSCALGLDPGRLDVLGATPFDFADHVEDVDVVADEGDRYPVFRGGDGGRRRRSLSPTQAASASKRLRFVEGGPPPRGFGDDLSMSLDVAVYCRRPGGPASLLAQ